MAKNKIVKLSFISPLHIGRGLGEAYDTAEKTLHSDTISGALTATFCSVYPARDAISFMNKYRVSSAFPFYGNNYFLPKPLVKVNIKICDEDDYLQKKKLKKIEFIELSLWQELVAGRELSVNKNQISSNGKFLYSGPAPDEALFKDDLQQRVTVPRDGGDSKPYYLDRRFFSRGAGLYFFLSSDDETEKILDTVLEHLGTIGFGTDKSVGNGQFEAVFSEIELDPPVDSGKCILLSMACPIQEEISSELLINSSYQIVSRGGFIAGTSLSKFRHLRKKSIYMFVEGSVFPVSKLDGKIVNVRPDWNDSQLHPVFRDGRSFCIPVNF